MLEFSFKTSIEFCRSTNLLKCTPYRANNNSRDNFLGVNAVRTRLDQLKLSKKYDTNSGKSPVWKSRLANSNDNLGRRNDDKEETFSTDDLEFVKKRR